MSTKSIKTTYPTEYVLPTTGVLSYMPASWVPFAEMIRFHNGRGVLFSYVPSIIGLMYAANIAETPIEISTIAKQAGRIFICFVFFRSAACGWNDIVDRDIDRQTPRCALRPVARGAITAFRGSVFVGILLLLGFLFLRGMNSDCTTDALMITALSFLYPFGKRFTHFVAVLLGATVALTPVLAVHALGIDPWAESARTPTLCLLGAIILIVAFYNTCSGCADTEDDARNGAKSISVLFRGTLVLVLVILASAAAALLHAFGSLIEMGTVYVSMSVYGSFVPLVMYLVVTKANSRASYFNFWKPMVAVSYLSILGGLVGNYLEREYGLLYIST